MFDKLDDNKEREVKKVNNRRKGENVKSLCS